MDREEVGKKVKQLLAENMDIDEGEIHDSALLVNDLGIDSFGGIQLFFTLTEEFGIKCEVEKYQDMEKVSDIIQFVSEKISCLEHRSSSGTG